MVLPASFQLSVELTKLLPISEALGATAAAVYKHARDLKRSGSDFLSEEDLLAVFGRGRVDPKLERHFKDVVSIATFNDLYPSSEIRLEAGPGPTIHRALKHAHHLSMVIQLSFLGATHERTTLASNLVSCLNERFRLGVPGTNPDASFEGISSVLKACSTQTSQFPWELYTGLVEARLPRSCQFILDNYQGWESDAWRTLSPNSLLAAIDYLYLVQRFPEDRVIVTQDHSGLIPLVIWAHYILGLTVLVKSSPDGDIVFGDALRPHAIINWAESIDSSHAVYLLDSSMEVVLSAKLQENLISRLVAEERSRLKGYGTKVIQRILNRKELSIDPTDLYQDFAHVVLAFGALLSRSLYHVDIKILNSRIPSTHRRGQLDNSLLFEAGEVMYDGIVLNRSTIKEYMDLMRGHTLNECLPSFPHIWRYLQRFSSQKHRPQTASDSNSLPGTTVDVSLPRGLVSSIMMLAVVVLAFSKVVDIKSCSEIPLVIKSYGGLYWAVRDGVFEQLGEWDCMRPLQIREDEWLNITARMLLQDEYTDEHRSRRKRMSLVSGWGWSIFLSNLNDTDPTEIDCERLFIKRGTPTNNLTNEQKGRILDSPPMTPEPAPPVIVDSEGPYSARCAIRVTSWVDFYSSKDKEFWQTRRFDLCEDSSPVSGGLGGGSVPFPSLYASYRQLHRALWVTTMTSSCPHHPQSQNSAKLLEGMVTVKGFRWAHTNPDYDICICLVKGDRHARWLVLAHTMDDCSGGEPYRNILLRTDDCCENCAAGIAKKFGGRWLVVV